MIPDIHPQSMGPLALKGTLPDVGHLATWTVSSHKPGFDVNCLRDDDPETFWQSDGPQPHYITLQFAKKVPVQKLAIMLNFAADDSYTPVKLLIKAGTGLYDLQDVKTITMDKPTGWITFDVGTDRAKDGHGYKPLSIYALQVVIAANHMNGKDTHVRGLRVLGAREATMRDDDLLPFTSLAFKMYEKIR